MEILPVGTELFHEHGRPERRRNELTDRQTDRQTHITKLLVAFRNFAEAPKSAQSG